MPFPTTEYYLKNKKTGELFKVANTFDWGFSSERTLKVFVYAFKHTNKEYGWLLRDHYKPNFAEGLIEIGKENLEEEKQKAAMISELRK